MNRNLNMLSRFLPVIILGILFIPKQAVGAQSGDPADSLHHLLNMANEDSLRCRIMLELANTYKYGDTLEALYFLGQAEELAASLDELSYLGRNHEIRGEMLAHSGQYDRAILAYDRALSYYNEARDNEGYYETLKDKGNVYLFQSEYEEALSYYETALDFYRRNEMPEGASRCLNNMGIIYKNRGEYVEALSAYEESLLLISGTDEMMQVAQAFINMGNVFVFLGNYHGALEYFEQALEIAEEEGSRKDYALCLMNTGVIQNKCDNHPEAHQLYQRAMRQAQELGDPVLISNCLINIGTNLSEMGRFEEALDYVLRGEAIKEELGDTRTISNSYINRADIHYLMGEYEDAIALYNQAIPVKEELGDKEGLVRCYLGLAHVNVERENYRIANMMADSALNLSQEINALEHMAAAYGLKETVAAIRGYYQSAYQFCQMNRQIQDSLLDEQTSRAVMEMEYRHRSKALASENENLRIQSGLTAELMKKRNAFLYAIGGIALLLALGLSLGMVFFRSLRASSHKLEEKNLVITRQNMKLDSLNRTKDRMMSIIAHDLRGTIGNQLTAIEVLNRVEASGQEGIDRKKLLGNLKHSASYSLELLENLLHWSRLEESKSYFHPEEINLRMVTRICVSLFDETARNKQIEVVNTIEEDILMKADRIMMETIIRNLLSNAIKFSERGTKIVISAGYEAGALVFSIEDRGLGMNPEQIDKVLNNGGYSIRGTANEKGAGIGMTLVREFTAMHQGRLLIESEPGKGTTITIAFPGAESNHG